MQRLESCRMLQLVVQVCVSRSAHPRLSLSVSYRKYFLVETVLDKFNISLSLSVS